ncbi:uncharacterized protein L3040_003012 [Drepanopeziza brunnea f. sp. 'multigermtubi']|uniref:Complex I intermediate-associated protein 30 n=1 Tax=Marssonina brunnea f. sp. multigermtubi (strain MB_m1) TaxID=1072389 RepID=K1WWZ9_MARBU|nr:complex I intermediate-associated protein 30 [Drepanopeziza brunnea f. sp. 'multigermtubi' MB_m1]EKD13208.1 complex I intermediate-associated protein 30 [Drepanopeziza brunnea f. sp. 'multigermtubi' MB_m1]KAJ5047170.1 hypothetical protein L3040_003012 [Drepanopeziza brunnea f. sp. 'multigermtubi']
MLTTLAVLLLTTRAAAGATLAFLQPWNANSWVASDDRVRPGGVSTSTLSVLAPGSSAANPFDEPIIQFSGTLNSTALGGAGFASQRTVDDWPGVDLSAYAGLAIEVPYSDGKTYTLTLRDDVVASDEASFVNWEWNFQVPATSAAAETGGGSGSGYAETSVRLRDLVPTFRGRVLNDTEPLNLANIRRVSIMIRSFFGEAEQEGDYELRIKSILATTTTPTT